MQQQGAWNASNGGERPSLLRGLADLDRELQRGAATKVAVPAADASAQPACDPDHCVPCEALAALERAESAEASASSQGTPFAAIGIAPNDSRAPSPARAGRAGRSVRLRPLARQAGYYIAVAAMAGVSYYALNLPALEAWSQSLDTFTTSWIIDRRQGDTELRPAVLRWSVGDERGLAGLLGAARFAPHASASLAIEAGLRGSRAKTLGASPAILVDVLADAGQTQEVRLPVRLVGLDGRAAISSLLIRNLPPSATLSGGQRLDDGRWVLAPSDLDRLMVRLVGEPAAEHDLELELIGHDGTVLANNALRLSIAGRVPQMVSSRVPAPEPATGMPVQRVSHGIGTDDLRPAMPEVARAAISSPVIPGPVARQSAVGSAAIDVRPGAGLRSEEAAERARLAAREMAKPAPRWKALVSLQQIPAGSIAANPKALAAQQAAAKTALEQLERAAEPAPKAMPASQAKVDKVDDGDDDDEPVKPSTKARSEPSTPPKRESGRVEPTAATLPRKPTKPVEPQKVAATRAGVDAIQGPRPASSSLGKPMPGWAPFQTFNQQP